jgi:hypothetical protein
LDEAKTQQMLNTEFGGMNEVLADLYADTGDKRWLALSHRFDHQAVVGPLSRREDRLAGLHGNTQVPKLLGVLKQYMYTGDEAEGIAARFFWDAVVNDHTYVTGGHGRDEYFGPADQLAERVDGRTDESCNVYNLLKMTRQLFALNPSIKYAEFEERALFNHVLGSIDPEDGRTCYMVPVGRGVRHEYQDMFRSFTCCVGTGMESHGLHGDGIYYESGDQFWVNLFVPSTAEWKTAGAFLTMDTTFPEGESATLKFKLRQPKTFTILLRRPSWAGDGFVVQVNNQPVKEIPTPGSYVELTRRWKTGDAVSIVLPKKLHLEALPDNKNRAAVMWGPLVLAGDLGPERRGPFDAVPSFVNDDKPVTAWVQPAPDKLGIFRSVGAGRILDDAPTDVELVPFYRLHRRTYAIYWDLYTAEAWKKKLEEVAAANEKRRQLEAATISFVEPGNVENEKSFNQQGEDTSLDRMTGRPGRRTKKWFSYELPIESKPGSLLVTHNTDERGNRSGEVTVDSQRVGEQSISRSSPGSVPGKFFDVEYALPAELLKDKKKITVKFQATGGNETPTVFGVRIVKSR